MAATLPGIGAALLSLSVLLLLMGVHPFVLYPLSLHLLRRFRPRPLAPQAETPTTVALCVCAYNEERVIRSKVENMLALREAVPQLELLVYVDAANDGTASILREYGGALRLVVSPSRHGKTHGMNTLVAMTSAEVIVFSDANVMFAPDAVQRLVAPFADRKVGAVCGHLRYVHADGNVTAECGSLYWRLEEHIKALESVTGSVMGADGSIFAIRRSMHFAPPPDLIDDMFVSFSVLCAGGRIIRAEDAVAYEEAVSRPGEEFRRKIRISCQAFNVHRALWPKLRRLPVLDQYKYVSHKLLRWMAIYLLSAGAAGTLGGLALLGLPMVATGLLVAGLVLLGLIVRAQDGMLATLRGVLEAFVATGIGIWRSLRGDRFQTWSPPASARAPLTATAALPR